MNNYINYPNNYDYQQNITAQPNTNNYKPQELYNPYEGFIRGNMFPTLYDAYRNEQPYKIEPINEQAEILTNLDMLEFATLELNLYLDLHPNDKQAIDLFNNYMQQQNHLLKQYENKYGPIILNSNALNTYPWAWNNRPWPWEN